MEVNQQDLVIITRVKNGNTAAFALLVDKYQKFVFNIVLKIVKQHEEAEEVAQDVFLKAYKNLSAYRGESKFSTWLYTISYTSSLSHIRKKKTVTKSLDDERNFYQAENHDSGFRADAVEQKSKVTQLNKAISLLAVEDATIIELFYKSEQSLEEICDIMEISLSNAKVKLFRARKKLKETLESLLKEEVKHLL